MSHSLSVEFGGRTLTIETGRMARLAGGAVTVRYGDTVVLGTANRVGAAARPRLLPAHDRLRGADVRRGQDPRRLHQARVAPVGGRDPRLPADRPPDPAALPRGVQGRRPVRHHGPLHRPGERPGHPGHDRRVGRPHDQRDPVPGPDRGHPRRPRRRRVRHQPDDPAARGERARPRRLRHARRDHDGRGGRQDPPRGRDGGRHPLRPPRPPAAHRPAARAPGGGRQGQAPAVPRSRAPSRSSTSRPRPRPAPSS